MRFPPSLDPHQNPVTSHAAALVGIEGLEHIVGREDADGNGVVRV